MNIWHPAKNEAEATAWFRTTAAIKAGTTVAAMVEAGWTIPIAVEYGYIRLMPGAPEHLRVLPAPPMMPASDTMKALSPAWSFGAAKEPSEITKEVVRQIVNRDNHGVTLDRDDLSLSDWLQHMAEELMDGAHYALAAKRVQQPISERNNAYFLALLERCCARATDTNAVIPGHRGTWDSAMKAVMRAVEQELSK